MRLPLANVHVGMELLEPISSLASGLRLTNEHLRLLHFLKVDEIEVAPVEMRAFTADELEWINQNVKQYERTYQQWEERIALNPYEALEFIHSLFQRDVPLSAIVTYFSTKALRKNHVIDHAIYRALVARTLSKYRGDPHPLQFDYGVASHIADASYAKIRKWSHMRYFSKMERELFYQHPTVSSRMIESSQILRPRVARLVAEHHERMDGSGFPNRLTVDSLHPASPLFIVADRFCQLTAPRTFRKALTPEEAYFYMWRNEAYEEEALTLIATLLGFYHVGRHVVLSSGVSGLIERYTPRIAQPIVVDSNQQRLDLTRIDEIEIISFQSS